MFSDVEKFIFNQFNNEITIKSIVELNINGIDFVERCKDSTKKLLYPLYEIAHDLKKETEISCNKVLERNAQIADPLDFEWFKPNSRSVSGYTQSYLCKHMMPEILVNGGNSYPDLYLADADYTPLPKGSKNLTNEQKDKPYLSRYVTLPVRPNKIPDGLEVKATQCSEDEILTHGPQVGLHLLVLWEYNEECFHFRVDDIKIGFINQNNYRTYDIKTKSDTRKYFLKFDKFISLL